MIALQEPASHVMQSGWDQKTLVLLGILLILLAAWLCYRIFRHQPPEDAVETEGPPDVAATTLITKVPPPPLPKVEKIAQRLESEYPEFSQIVRSVLVHTPAATLLANAEIRRGFSHLEVLLMRVDKVTPKSSTLGIATESKMGTPEIRRDAKATMLTILRLMQDTEGVREKGGASMDALLDRFLEKV